jgi:hypothetical protein
MPLIGELGVVGCKRRLATGIEFGVIDMRVFRQSPNQLSRRNAIELSIGLDDIGTYRQPPKLADTDTIASAGGIEQTLAGYGIASLRRIGIEAHDELIVLPAVLDGADIHVPGKSRCGTGKRRGDDENAQTEQSVDRANHLGVSCNGRPWAAVDVMVRVPVTRIRKFALPATAEAGREASGVRAGCSP